jgi:hypothetical protein
MREKEREREKIGSMEKLRHSLRVNYDIAVKKCNQKEETEIKCFCY